MVSIKLQEISLVSSTLLNFLRLLKTVLSLFFCKAYLCAKYLLELSVFCLLEKKNDISIL